MHGPSLPNGAFNVIESFESQKSKGAILVI